MADRPLYMTTTICSDDIIPVWTEWCGDGEEGRVWTVSGVVLGRSGGCGVYNV